MFELWCEANQADPLTCGSREILLFLQDQLDRRKTSLTLKGMVVAIKATQVRKGRFSEDCSILIAQFLRVAQRLRACAQAPAVLPRDLELILDSTL